ncbi:MAG TPA: glycosyltransferase, partial [Chthoniobacterales bacterium]
MTALAYAALLLALAPAIVLFRNLRIFPPLAKCHEPADSVSILIPARDEAENIAAAVGAALANLGAEVLVLDDGSTDATPEIVRAIAAGDARLRLVSGEALPPGWCGKNWACTQLAAAATRPLLLFVDADVRLAPHAAATIAAWMRRHDVQLASGVPFQELGSFAERLVIPLIHFVLLGFLPLRRMRRSRNPAYAAACGQLIAVHAAAYRKCGGHAAVRDRIHDGLAVP